MKKIKLLLLACVVGTYSTAQNIDDNKVSFSYIQLPLVKIDDRFTNYEVRVQHAYQQANEDSLAAIEMNKATAQLQYEQRLGKFHQSCDSLDRIHLNQMAAWEKKVNAGVLNADGTPLLQPAAPVYPLAPVLKRFDPPLIHTDISDEYVQNLINLEGFEKGVGGVIISVDFQAIRNIQIIETKSGTGAATKYNYKCAYVLPVVLSLESPTQGSLENITLFEGVRYYNMNSFASKYEHELYMKDNKVKFFQDLETSARNSSISEINQLINDKFGYLLKSRTVEIYSLNKYKQYDYSDVTNAYTLTVQALALVKNDRDRSGAADKIEEALEAWTSIMQESNVNDNAARINDKISAMIQCNITELQVWLAEYDQAEMTANLARNSNIGKAKRHIEDQLGFYANQRKRWEANY